MGAPRELLGRLSQRRAQAAVLIQIQLLLQGRRLGPVMSRYLNRTGVSLVAITVIAVAMAVASVAGQKALDPQTAVNNAFNQFRTLKEGKNADYIPALAKVDP